MKILFDMNHPADVHQFKYVIELLKKNKHQVVVTARNKECTHQLLKAYNIPFIPRKSGKGLIKKAFALANNDLFMIKTALKHKPDILVGACGNSYITHAAFILRKPSILFDDTEHAWLQRILSFPFAKKIYTPESYLKNIGKKQVKYPGSKEQAYLDLRYFKPTKTPYKKPYILLRIVSWEAAHDIGHKMNILEMIPNLEKLAHVLISSEKPLPVEYKKYHIKLAPEQIHDVLYHANLVISEGGTMAVESAVLGTPTIYTNPLKMGYSNELVKNKNMVQTTNIHEIIKMAKKLMLEPKSPIKAKKDLNKYMMEEILSCI